MAPHRRAAAVAIAVLASPAAAAHIAQGLSAPFDCQEGYANWARDWSDEKKAWCCADASSPTASLGSMVRAGCVVQEQGDKTLGSPVASKVSDFPTKYDAYKEIAPPSPEPTAAGPPPGWPECGQLCEYNGHHSSCAGTMRWAAATVFGNRPGACENAHRVVRQQCPQCSDCSVENARCGASLAAAPAATAEPPLSPPALPPPPQAHAQATQMCEGSCVFDSHNATCRQQVHYVSIQHLSGRPGSCSKAHDMVVQVCSECTACSYADVGCPDEEATTTPPPPPFAASTASPSLRATSTWTYTSSQYDCNYLDSCSLWSDEQRHFCYWEGGIVCKEPPVTPPSTTSKLYDCQEMFSVAAGWSAEKAAWCCKYEGLGCVTDLEGAGVKPEEAMSFRRRWDADEPRPRKPPAKEPESAIQQGPHWMAVTAVVGGCVVLGVLLIATRARSMLLTRNGYRDVLPGPGPALEVEPTIE